MTGHALVTGSTLGIGRGIAEGLRAAGATVINHSLEPRPDNLPKGAAHIQKDLSQIDAATELAAEAFEIDPTLDVLVCNAGSFFDVPFLEMDQKRWSDTFSLNARAPFFLAQAFARRWIEGKRAGVIVIVASTNAFQGELDSVAYDASKGALVSMTRAMALELAPHGIRVNALAPGVIWTSLTQPWIDTNKELVAHYEKNIPMGRIGEPEDCAGAAVFLASEAAAYITGQTIVVDGGLTAQQIGRV